MTNAKKYLKDGVTPAIFCKACTTGAIDICALKEWLCKEATPTLTEDERVILRNINKRFNRIIRNEFGYLILTENGCEKIGEAMHTLYAFNHLFQFIKNGEEYSIEELLKGE